MRIVLSLLAFAAAQAFGATASLSSGSSCTYSAAALDSAGNLVVTCQGATPTPPSPTPTPTPTPTPPPTCTGQATGTLPAGWTPLVIGTGAYAALKMPVPANAGHYIEVTLVQTTSSPQDLNAEVAISTCPGEFVNVAPACHSKGSVYSGATSVDGYVATTTPGLCALAPGLTYYANIRTTNCPSSSCGLGVQQNGNLP